MNCQTNKMNCEHCQKKLSDVYYTDYVSTCHVNEVGQKVDTGNKELYFCNYECSCRRAEHYAVKQKIIFIKQSKETAEKFEEMYEHGDTSILILIHFYKAIINFLRGKINQETFEIFAQDAMEVGEEIGDTGYLSIVRDTQYAILFMKP